MGLEIWVQSASMAQYGTIADLLAKVPPDSDIVCIEGDDTIVFVRRDALAQFWRARVQFLDHDLWSGWGAHVNYWSLMNLCPKLALPYWRHGDEGNRDWNFWTSPLPAAEVIQQWREAIATLTPAGR